MRHPVSHLIIIVGCFTALATAQVKPTTQQLLHFHVSDGNFKPIEVAPWVRDNTIQAFLPVEGIDKAASLGVKVVHGGGPDIYFPLMNDDPNAGPPAEVVKSVRAFVAKARSHNMRVLVGINPAAPVEIVRQHPEWLICLTPDIESVHARIQLDLTRPEHYGYRSLGLNTPYGDYLIECLAEIMERFDVDGFSFDGNYHPAINYAPHERELFTRETGRPFPESANLDNLDYRLYLIWADGKLEDWYRKLHERLRRVKPDAAICTWTTNAGRYGHFFTSPRVMSTRMNRLIDSPIQEWWMDEVNLGSSVVPAFGAAYVRAVTGNRTGASEPYLMSRGNPYSSDNFPKHELLTCSLLALTNGSMVPLAMSPMAEPAFKELARREPWCVNARPMPWAAVLVSEQTRQFYAYGNIMERFLSHALGVFRAAYESHLPVTLINDWDITEEGLHPYKVLVLPNAACLSDEQAQTIRDWVAAGGGLVATCETSLFDELGRPRHDFALAELFGTSYLGRIATSTEPKPIDANFAIVIDDQYWAKRQGHAWLRFTPGDPQGTELFNDPRLWERDGGTFKGPLVHITDPRPPMQQSMIMFPDLGADTFPAGTIGEYGKGRVVYFAVGIDAANFSYALRYTRLLLARSIQWAAQETFPIQVDAPMCVQSTFFTQQTDDGRQIVVHLFNDINTTSGHGLPEVDVPLREESLPIHGFKVYFDLPVGRVVLQPENIELELKPQDDRLEVELPPLLIHSMLVAELR